MKPSDRIWELANERCVRQGINPTEVGVQDLANYLDEQRGLVVITAPEGASEAQIGKMAEACEYLTERHDIVILPFGTKVDQPGRKPIVPSAEAYRAAFGCDPPRQAEVAMVVPPCGCCGKPCNLRRLNAGSVNRCDWCMSHCRIRNGLHLAQPGEHRQVCSDGGLLHDMQGKPSCPSCGYTPKLVEPPQIDRKEQVAP